tara:strand:- start:304 stop:1083 length:780 start_codon:yes stop_codon:yes gene_type:complete
MNDLFQLILLSVVQGITEFLPISSSAHLIVLPKLFNWEEQGLLIDVSMHFGSLIALSMFYIKNLNEFKNLNSTKNYISFDKILIGSTPVLFFGYIFHDYVEANLRTIEIISILTILVAILIIFTEFFKKNTKKISEISNFDMLVIGFMQAIALIPGTSRAGIIIFAALLLGYNKKSSIVIALVLSFPVIFLAMLYKLYSLDSSILDLYLVSKISLSVFTSFIISYFVIKYFLSYINRIGLYPFMIYRIIFGLALIIFFT